MTRSCSSARQSASPNTPLREPSARESKVVKRAPGPRSSDCSRDRADEPAVAPVDVAADAERVAVVGTPRRLREQLRPVLVVAEVEHAEAFVSMSAGVGDAERRRNFAEDVGPTRLHHRAVDVGRIAAVERRIVDPDAERAVTIDGEGLYLARGPIVVDDAAADVGPVRRRRVRARRRRSA